MLGSLGILLVVWQGATLVVQDKITVGTFTAVLIYLLKLQFPMAGLGWVANLIQRSNAATDRLIHLMENMPLKKELPDNKPPPPDKAVALLSSSLHSVQGLFPASPSLPAIGHIPHIEVRHLNYSYDNGPVVLSEINLDIPPGTKLGIAGPVGSGKTTLMQLICGIYTPLSGQLFLDGKPRETWSDSHWQSFFALAPQDGFLFSQSIRDNILLGQSAQSILSVEAAGERAGLQADMAQIPNEYEAILGERGINLSGGQRQRVGLARALMNQPAVLCLDDTLSALDTQTEAKVAKRLRESLDAHTVLTISHRFSAIRFCDHIIFLEKGVIAEQGTHDHLLELNKRYASVYRQQILASTLEGA
jgi:ATP-binding cassette subfamily B protein